MGGWGALLRDSRLGRYWLPVRHPLRRLLGHRGFTHSLPFAALLAGVVSIAFVRKGPPGLSPVWTWSYLFLATASHGFLDAMTDGGLGIAFFSPFDNDRYFLPWRPIHVAPIGISRFFTTRGLAVMRSEFLWIWVPAAALAISAWLLRRPREVADS
ncbi:MAG TPA: metal-dependent hydrolase [Methylomirabilota bacterium]|nr:metal-dependent hydrolase [Methylomirabilota bacterium]